MIDFIHSKTADKIIYMYLGQQCKYKSNSVVVSHGIFWDYQNGSVDYAKAVIQPALDQTKLISVDTNTINWIRATFTNYTHNITNKLYYIPNFADTEVFNGEHVDSDKIRILYPRRNDPARGINEFENVATKLLAEYENIEIQFAIDMNCMCYHEPFLNWYNSHINKDRITWRSYKFEEMHEAYENADISVIPTMSAEGTSLGCIEAMAMNQAIVSTNIGGLCNLIIDNYNGLLVNPNENDLYNGIKKLIEDKTLRTRLSKNAKDMVNSSFNKNIWKDKWSTIIGNL
jgi:glycosyltransferase involved in cell wall biosynthesis